MYFSSKHLHLSKKLKLNKSEKNKIVNGFKIDSKPFMINIEVLPYIKNFLPSVENRPLLFVLIVCAAFVIRMMAGDGVSN
jgi:hypothetical protein